jgi:hypothetical protein
MPILGGFHVEGNDHLILHAFAAKLLELPENEIEIDYVDAPGRGWEFVLDFIPKALKRFYNKCAKFAIISIDNDGGIDLDQAGVTEDPIHPRHSNHSGNMVSNCRYCLISQTVTRIRSELNWIQKKPGTKWPIIIVVPVEMIETWLLILQGAANIQRKPRHIQKHLLYGKPVATKTDVMKIALPLVRDMTTETLASLTQMSPSFSDFQQQIATFKAIICENADCW